MPGNYPETVTVSTFAAWISSRPPLAAQKATTAMVITTRTISMRFADRDDEFPPPYVKRALPESDGDEITRRGARYKRL